MAPHIQSITKEGPGPAMYQYPGLGLPLRYNPQYDYDFYPHGARNHGSQSHLIFVRELAMMDVMDKLTDKPDWHKKVFDAEIVEKWEKEALAIPNDEFYKMAAAAKSHWSDVRDIFDKETEGIMNESAFRYCIEELRGKARYFEKTGVIPTLDACASVAKSDSLVTRELHVALCNAFHTLKDDHSLSPDWHPNSNDMVQDLVHPSMYPLVYGRTRVFPEECVGVENAIRGWAGKGTMIPKDDETTAKKREQNANNCNSELVTRSFWSDTYQWLPANLAFQQDGHVKFTSYINNLHPDKYADIYKTIEKLVETLVPMWDQCLALMRAGGGAGDTVQVGRQGTRMPSPDHPDDDEPENWIPSDPKECADAEVNEDDLADAGWDPEYYEPDELAEYKWKAVRKPRIPDVPEFKDVDYAPTDDQRLMNRFRESGLQIIVKMASIELTPEKPEFPAGGWHVEGQMNEYICATALYYLDSENITDNSLSFRMATTSDLESELPVNQDAYHWLEAVYGTSLGGGSAPCLQNYGSVQTRQGRLLAFPNVFQHRVSPFQLIDRTKPGHRRFIALWLVDPTKRIISTANVPPQQMSWYVESLLGTTSSARKEALAKLPAELVALLQEKGLPAAAPEIDGLPAENAKLPEELMDMVREYFDAEGDAMPMGLQEAKEHRAKLMRERGAHHQATEEQWMSSTYFFCEH